MKVKLICHCCEKEFFDYPSNSKRRKEHYCSQECYDMYRKHYHSNKVGIDFKIDENGCFICTSHKAGKRGYPKMNKKLVFRHVYGQMFEPLKKGELVRHLCDNKMCINPEHLRKGTQKENVQDAIRNGKFPIGSNKTTAKYDELEIYGVKVLIEKTNLTDTEIEHITKIPRSTITSVRHGKQWKHVKVSGLDD